MALIDHKIDANGSGNDYAGVDLEGFLAPFDGEYEGDWRVHAQQIDALVKSLVKTRMNGLIDNLITDAATADAKVNASALVSKGAIPNSYATLAAAIAAGQGKYPVTTYTGSDIPGASPKSGMLLITTLSSYTYLEFHPAGQPIVYYAWQTVSTWYGWFRENLQQSVTLGSSDNANSFLTPGVYKCSGTTAGNNFPYTYGLLEVAECNGYVLQRMTDFNTAAEKRRTYNGSSWLSWA
jgi:hypothetical protein